MTKEQFVQSYFNEAKNAGERFNMDPAIILSQAALESGWGSSFGARVRKNFFGITAYGSPNPFWDGSYSIANNQYKLKFRVYKSVQDSFYDFARLISSKYKKAHANAQDSTSYAQAIAYSPYISEKNGDNRENYRKLIISSHKSISEIIKKKDLN